MSAASFQPPLFLCGRELAISASASAFLPPSISHGNGSGCRLELVSSCQPQTSRWVVGGRGIGRDLCAMVAEVSQEKAAADEESGGIADKVSEAEAASMDGGVGKLKRRALDWKKAENMMKTGGIHEGKVEGCNTGGVLVRYISLLGFLPFSQMDWSKLPADGSKNIADLAKELVGKTVRVKITEADEEAKRLIFSEKRATFSQNLKQISEGEVFEGQVNAVTDYGAFVNLRFPDGTYPISGLVHISELSWDIVRNPRDVIHEGQSVKVKVVSVDRSKGRLALSIKQLEADPLFETLDTIMPVEAQTETASSSDESYATELSETPLPGLEPICEELLKEEGIAAVTLGRQAIEKRVVSQDLEFWVSSERIEDGSFTLLARAGRQVQEVHVTTSLDKEGIKAAVQRVTGRVE